MKLKYLYSGCNLFCIFIIISIVFWCDNVIYRIKGSRVLLWVGWIYCIGGLGLRVGIYLL